MKSKLSILKEYALKNDWKNAIKIASKFPRLGEERGAILDAHMAITNPRFCLSIKKDPELLIQNGVAALKLKYNL